MKALILAAGYGTRLYPLTKDRAKPLLEVRGEPIVQHILKKLEKIEQVDRVLVVTNHKFYQQFLKWSKKVKSSRPIKVFDDGTLTNEDRLGAIGDIDFVMKAEGIVDDLLVIGGDNLLEESLEGFVEFWTSKKGASVVGLYDIADRNAARRFGVLALDKTNRVIDFEEKPKDPPSTLIAICAYLFPKEKLLLFKEYLESSNLSKDAPGNYIKWLHKRDVVYGYIFSGRWYDIGDMDSYKKANEEYGG